MHLTGWLVCGGTGEDIKTNLYNDSWGLGKMAIKIEYIICPVILKAIYMPNSRESKNNLAFHIRLPSLFSELKSQAGKYVSFSLCYTLAKPIEFG